MYNVNLLKYKSYGANSSHSFCYNKRMMNIYKYIRSKDVREYNEKIGHKFNATESAFLVWLNPDISLKEKHDAWREIMRDMADEEIAKRPNADYAPSLFALLNQFIKTDNSLIDEFYKTDSQTVYSFQYYCKGDASWCEDHGRIYSDFDYMKSTIEKDFDLDIVCIEYTKKYLSSPYRKITLVTDKNGNAMSVNGDFIFGEEVIEKDDFFSGLWVDVPTPFRYGDIVCSKKTPYYNMVTDSQPFVLLSLANWTAETAEQRGKKLSEDEKKRRNRQVERLKQRGDITDMMASGYYLDADCNNRFTNSFHCEVLHYVDLEYYRGEYKGGNRVLLSIKHYLKGDINEAALFKACEIIKKQEEVKEEIEYLDLLDEWIEKLKIKDE